MPVARLDHDGQTPRAAPGCQTELSGRIPLRELLGRMTTGQSGRGRKMEANKKGFKGVWLCAAIYESSELSAVEKLLLAEIDALTTDTDACYATNAHFSERLGVTVTRVDHLLGKLTRLGYIVRVSFDGRVTRRVLAPEYSSNPGHSIALIGAERRQSSIAEKSRAALRKIAGLHI